MSEYVKMTETKAGDLVKTDGGFTCMRANLINRVQADKKGELYVTCGSGRHYLDGQLDEAGYLIGLSKPK